LLKLINIDSTYTYMERATLYKQYGDKTHCVPIWHPSECEL